MAGKKVVNRFKELLAVKERREMRSISQRDVAAATGISRSAIDSYATNTPTRYDAHVILALCEYFDCTPGDLLVIETASEDAAKKNDVTESQLVDKVA